MRRLWRVGLVWLLRGGLTRVITSHHLCSLRLLVLGGSTENENTKIWSLLSHGPANRWLQHWELHFAVTPFSEQSCLLATHTWVFWNFQNWLIQWDLSSQQMVFISDPSWWTNPTQCPESDPEQESQRRKTDVRSLFGCQKCSCNLLFSRQESIQKSIWKH